MAILKNNFWVFNFANSTKICKNHENYYPSGRFTTFLRIEILFFIKACRLKFIAGSKRWSTKVGAKLLSNLVIFSILSFGIPFDFHDSIRICH